MTNTLKFKPAWFEILNRHSAEIRDAVIAAVTVYFYTGDEPTFTNEAASVAFDFIRHEIDTARARKRNREGRSPDRPIPAPDAQPSDNHPVIEEPNVGTLVPSVLTPGPTQPPKNQPPKTAPRKSSRQPSPASFCKRPCTKN